MISACSFHQAPRVHGSKRDVVERPGSRQRSESRRISRKHDRSKLDAHEKVDSAGFFPEGDVVKIFSRSGNAWLNAEVKEMIDSKYIRVEYERDEYWCSKVLHLDSEHLQFSADSDCDEKSHETQQKHEEPKFRCGDEVHYHRDATNIWVHATITKVLMENADIFYELKYEAWDEAPACMKKNQVSEMKLLAMQESQYQQLSRGSLNRSIRTDEKPLWCCTSSNHHIRKVQAGDKMWFKRANGDGVLAKIETMHEWEGEDAMVDLTYTGLDEQGVIRRMHKYGVTKGELAISQHPRNWLPSRKRTWCEDDLQASSSDDADTAKSLWSNTPGDSTEYFVVIGNPGSGKSTLLNSIIGERVFDSGLSIGEGLTKTCQSHKHQGTIFVDTPGLADVGNRNRERAAKKIASALSRQGLYKLAFVITLEAGHVRFEDWATIQLVIECLLEAGVRDAELRFAVIVNKVAQCNTLKHLQVIIDENGKEVEKKIPVVNLICVPEDSELEDFPKKGTLILPEKFKDFIDELPKVYLGRKEVEIRHDKFEQLRDKYQEQISKFEYEIEESERRMAACEEKPKQLDRGDLVEREEQMDRGKQVEREKKADREEQVPPCVPTTPERAKRARRLLCIGNAGVGTTTLKKIMEESVKPANRDRFEFLETRGLEDTENRKRDADVIASYLKDTCECAIFFVITLNSGRLRPQDVETINLVLKAAPEIGHKYSVVVNKLTKQELDLLSNPENLKKLEKNLFPARSNKDAQSIHFIEKSHSKPQLPLHLVRDAPCLPKISASELKIQWQTPQQLRQIRDRLEQKSWNRKARELGHHGVTLESILKFYSELGTPGDLMPGFDPETSTTLDVVQQAILPHIRNRKESLAQVLEGNLVSASYLVTYSCSNRFTYTVADMVATAFSSSGDKQEGPQQIVPQLKRDKLPALKEKLKKLDKLCLAFWFFPFSMSQHDKRFNDWDIRDDCGEGGCFEMQPLQQSLEEKIGVMLRNAEDEYQRWQAYVESSKVRWLKVRYLRGLTLKQELLPRCQALPTDAFEIGSRGSFEEDCLLITRWAVSHPWRSARHPDPDGKQLQWICAELNRLKAQDEDLLFLDYTGCYQHNNFDEDFWQICCQRHQQQKEGVPEKDLRPEWPKPGAPGVRTKKEERLFKDIQLKGLEWLFCFRGMKVLIAPVPPYQHETQMLKYDCPANPLPYKNRGWCLFEYAVAHVFRIIVNGDNKHVQNFCPIAVDNPDNFREAFKSVEFSSGGDMQTVIQMFDRVFERSPEAKHLLGSACAVLELQSERAFAEGACEQIDGEVAEIKQQQVAASQERMKDRHRHQAATVQLFAASRYGDAELVKRLMLQRADPTAHEGEDGSSALHAAAYHGHPNVLEMLVNQVEHTFEFSEHKNWFGETPLDVARERLRFCPSSNDAVQVFTCLFGRNPRAQERASRVMNSISSLDMRAYNQGFLEAVMLSPLIGDRTAPYRINSCDVDAVAAGIEKEERRVLEFECQEYNDWSYWRACFARGILRHGIEEAFTRRMDAAKMRQLLHDARNDSSNAESALPRCAIKLYTAATFLFKATNFAMRSKDRAFNFEHLEPYARLLNYSVRYYADKQPWKGRVHRVLPIYDDETVRKYSQIAKAVYDSERFFSWSGFISATAWVQECKIFQDLRKYGAGKECIVFIISPDPQGGSVYPVDLGDLASFGAEDRELLYPAGQQFKVIEYEGCHTREQFAKDFDLKFDIVKDKGEKLHVVRLQAVDAFTEFSDDFFKEGGNIKEAETFLQNRLQEVRRQGHTWNVSLYEDILARCWHKMGKYEEAESMFRQTLKVREQELGLTHPNTLNSCNSLAGLLHDMGKYEEAEPMFRQTLKVREQKLGLTHPDTLTSCNNLAALLRDMGKYEEAEPMFRQALKVQEQELGLTHPNTLNSCNNLALLLHDMGKYEEAEPMFRQTLKVQEQELGLTHPNTLTSCNNLAALLRDMGKYEEAEPMYRQTLQVAEAKLGAAHALTRACALGWASVLGKTSSC